MRISVLLFLAVFLCATNKSQSQSDYTVVYTHYYGINSKAEITSATSFRDEGLYINGDSICFYTFQYKSRKRNESEVGKESDHHAVYTLLKEKIHLLEYAFTNRFLKEDSIKTYQWELHSDSVKISGYKCYKAIAGSVTAWYTREINVSTGPAYYSGLPGVILQLRDASRNWLIIASSVVNNSPRIGFPKKMKRVKDYPKYFNRKN